MINSVKCVLAYHVLHLRISSGYNGRMAEFWKRWRLLMARGNDEGTAGRQESVFEWRYEPGRSTGDAGDRFDLEGLPAQEWRFQVERKAKDAERISGNETTREVRRDGTDIGTDNGQKDALVGSEYHLAAVTPSRLPESKAATQIRQQLDHDLERWWADGAIPSQNTLRNGLLLLEAGYSLDESQKMLLLHASLAHCRGFVTATRHLADPASSAVILAESLTDPDHPLNTDCIDSLLRDGRTDSSLQSHLARELYLQGSVASGGRRRLAAAALRRYGRSSEHYGAYAPDATASKDSSGEVTRTRPRWWRSLMVMAATLLILFAIFWYMRVRTSVDSVSVPAGNYLVGFADGTAKRPSGVTVSERSVSLSGFDIDRAEVTNAQYRRCFERRRCPRPASSPTPGRKAEFLNPAYNDFPVTNVSWADARTYCVWAGRRLPTADEWEVAAGAAIASGRRFVYPWGDHFDVRLANSVETNLGRTQPVGSYRPAGDSPAGASDMGGNVAEWTATTIDESDTTYVVKGGSFRDGANELRADAANHLPGSTRAEWLGFRCVWPPDEGR